MLKIQRRKVKEFDNSLIVLENIQIILRVKANQIEKKDERKEVHASS